MCLSIAFGIRRQGFVNGDDQLPHSVRVSPRPATKNAAHMKTTREQRRGQSVIFLPTSTQRGQRIQSRPNKLRLGGQIIQKGGPSVSQGPDAGCVTMAVAGSCSLVGLCHADASKSTPVIETTALHVLPVKAHFQIGIASSPLQLQVFFVEVDRPQQSKVANSHVNPTGSLPNYLGQCVLHQLVL